MTEERPGREASHPPLFWTFLGLGICLRLAALALTRDAPLPPDLWGYLSIASGMRHAFDTGFREPLFVWICRSLQALTADPASIFAVLRAAGIVLYIALFFLTHRFGRRLFSPPVALGACFLLAVNWSQIENDLNGLRNAWEGVLFMGTAWVLFQEDLPPRRWWLLAGLLAVLTLLKVTFLPMAALILFPWFRVRRWPLWKAAALCAVLGLAAAPHLWNNRRAHGDLFYSSNYLARNFRNIEFGGRPGFPTKDEVALNAFAPPDVTAWEMMFKLHRPAEAAFHTAEGVVGLLWGTATTRYFAKNTAWPLYALLLPGYLFGSFLLLRRRDGRLLLYLLVCFVLPFAFFKHIYWSYRYVVPLAPLTGLIAFAGLAELSRLWIRHRRRSAPPVFPVSDTRQAPSPLVSFLVPVFNERKMILETLQRLSALPFDKEILVVDDGSTDGTRDILSSHKGADVRIVFHERNAGKGAAIKTALAGARGQYAAIQDADGEYDPAEYPALLDILRREGLSAVYGSRFLAPNPTLYRRYLAGNKAMTAWLNLLCGSRYTDTYTCYKLIDRRLFQALEIRSTGFEMEAEISVKLALREVPLREHPIHYRPRSLEEGKKIGWRDAVLGAWATLAFWWEEGNRGLYGRTL